MALDWNSEIEPPLPMIVGHRGHRHRLGIPSPFGYFPAGARDSVGRLNSLPHRVLESVDRATSALVRSQTAFPDDSLNQAISDLREANANLQESARARLETLQETLALLQSDRVIRLPANFSTNDPSVPVDYRGFSPYRSHRPGPTPRGNDDGTNPLLQRSLGNSLSRDASNLPPHLGGAAALAAAMRSADVVMNIGDPASFGEESSATLNDLISSLPLSDNMNSLITRHGGAMHFHISGRGDMPRDLQALFGMSRNLARQERHRETHVEPDNVTFFSIRSTASRWMDEAKLLFGSTHPDKAYSRVLYALMAVLIPPALKSEKEARKIAEEAKKRRDEEERLVKEAKEAQEKKEAEELAAKEKQEAEEREAAERARVEAAATAGDVTSSEADGEGSEGATVQPMEGVETSPNTAAPVAAEETVPAADRPRVTTTIRGSQIDITDLGIDADFLQELPEDIREEVIASAVAERRSERAAAGAEPSEIDQEFLDALPAEIRDEIIQQERQDRRRREREEQRRQAAANGVAGPAAAPQEMDAASILATLPPGLRAQVLMEQDDEMLAALPADIVAQARAAMRDLPLSNVRSMPVAGRPRPNVGPEGETAIVKQARRATVQMLDKAGVATLLRLMFVFQQDGLRTPLYQVLQNVSENRHNRSEVISTLLLILQDGSTDMTAVERSFAHLSLKAKQPKTQDPKTPQTLKRTLTGVSLSVISNTDVSPLMVVQQCLSALIYLAKVNQHVASFFLTEHESGVGLKRTMSKKGKGKEIKATKYALNSLLTLLDRKIIMESSSVMESLSDLLSRITAPLQALERRQKEAAEQAKKAEAAASTGSATTTDVAAPAASAETGATVVLPSESMDTDGDAATIPAPPATTTVESTSEPVSAAEQSDKPVTESKESEQKKLRPFVPPVIPESNLKLVINIFVARECTGKTFRETLTTIKNLSCIPDAKAVFGRELVRKAQGLGEIILVDLEELLPQIQKASSGTEIQGVALAKFSPSGSDQNKLLRVLTALDHLFDPKGGQKKDTDTDGADESSVEKQDLLATLYENSTFGPMWEKLSACLSAIRQRESMLNVATILLPLIESLMVVCKNTTLKDVPISRSQIGKEMGLTSPAPESRMENLFFTFTEEHRKILNELVRHTPKLMSGTFSLLVKNPKVLEFDNKRNYFSRSIHNRNSQTRQSFPPLQLSVRRDQVFHDSFKSLYFKAGDEMKYGKLSIRFHGEEGVDAGGVTREWFQVLSRQMFDPGYALFIPVSSDRTTFHPNHMSSINPEHLLFFKFIGRIIGKALYEGRVLDCHFSRAVYKRILGKAVSIKDMESLDPEYYKSIVWMLENDITDIITETFSVDNDKFGVVETVDLIENGRNIPVTQENKQEYIRLMVEFKLTGSVQEQLDNFLKGFHEIIPAELVAIFNEQELELLISGLPEIDVDDWKSNTEYHNYTGASPQIQWFWRAIRSFDKEERAKLLQFVTGTSKVPLNGFKELEGMNGFSRFNIHRDYGNKDRLPSSHTCFNRKFYCSRA
jgi:E3 ubiquitin-protein ligase HUWE1